MTVETPRGARTRWGIDLERAVEKSLSGVRQGDIVGVRQIGKEPVKVIEKERDAEGRVMHEREVETHRNRWSVETTEFLKQRQMMAHIVRNQRISAQDAIRQHPTLKSTYTNLQLAEALANERIHPDSQREFLSRIRTELAHTVERGEALPHAVPLRQQPRHRAQLRDVHVR